MVHTSLLRSPIWQIERPTLFISQVGAELALGNPSSLPPRVDVVFKFDVARRMRRGFANAGVCRQLADGRLSAVPTDHDRVGGRSNQNVDIVLHEHGQEGINLVGIGAALTPLNLAFPRAEDNTDAGPPQVDLDVA
jgi:hypothetical protein